MLGREARADKEARGTRGEVDRWTGSERDGQGAATHELLFSRRVRNHI